MKHCTTVIFLLIFLFCCIGLGIIVTTSGNLHLGGPHRHRRSPPSTSPCRHRPSRTTPVTPHRSPPWPLPTGAATRTATTTSLRSLPTLTAAAPQDQFPYAITMGALSVRPSCLS
uniref:Uncharacterized protein n=1 Tax=Oryza meridionalis TaxID=40149 RepID=A0A0E0CEQ5_9ORYZ